jgi:hypothetical protein
MRTWGLLGLLGVLGAAGCSLGSGDNAPPVVTITAPTPGATVTGQVSIDVEVLDDSDIDKVTFFIDGEVLIKLLSPPYSTLWRTAALANNSVHTIKVEAIDLAGHKGSDQISVTVVNGPQSP